MNGLNQIHSQNETAVREANSHIVRAALTAGHSVIIYLDELGTQDLSRTPTVFPTQHALDQYIHGSVPAHLFSRLQIHRGSNVLADTVQSTPTAPTPVQPTGHAPNASPIQNHSIGDVFPYIIIYRSPVSNAWFVQTPTGELLPTPHATHQDAENHIRALRTA